MDPLSTTEQKTVEPGLWVDEYGNYLFRYAHSRLQDENAAEEVVQETFLAGIRHQEQYSGRGSQRAWLLGILKRKLVDFVRQRARHDRSQSFEDQQDPSVQLFDENGRWKKSAAQWWAEPSRRVESQELWEVLRACLAHLPRGQADAFMLSVLEEMESGEVCRTLEISESNLWVRLHRARLRLAICVGKRWIGDPQESGAHDGSAGD